MSDRSAKQPKPKSRRSTNIVAILPHLESQIVVLRDQRIMLDEDLAKLYGIETKVLIQAVKRNLERFPKDFMFQLIDQEVDSLRSQIVTSKKEGRGGRRTLPYAFTEQGVAMLSSVLNSPRAVAVNVEIMRTFVRMRALATSHGELAARLAELEQQTNALSSKHDHFSKETRQHLKQVFDVLRELMTPPPAPPKRPMGFIAPRDGNTKNARLTKPRAGASKRV